MTLITLIATELMNISFLIKFLIPPLQATILTMNPLKVKMILDVDIFAHYT